MFVIAGGQYTDFVEEGTLAPKPGFMLDKELFVRYAQVKTARLVWISDECVA